ncbi:MAG: hypothetical protein Q8O66_02475 [bacterium]|nr:hypothetical protein [bacterium]
MGIIPGPEQLTKKAIMSVITIPEGIIMLTIAVFFDILGIILFFLDFVAIGIPLSFLLDGVGFLIFGSWTIARSFFRGIIGKATEKVTEKMLSVGGGLEGAKQFQGQGPSAPVQTGKKVAKTGIKFGLGVVRFIIALLVELVPFLGDIMPGWTFFVISELISGEA